jgi:DNA-binding MarR family transcriptional regulator
MTDPAKTLSASPMWPMAAIAKRDGITRQAIHKAVKGFLNAGAVTRIERDDKGRIATVDLAEYDLACSRTVSARAHRAFLAVAAAIERVEFKHDELALAVAKDGPGSSEAFVKQHLLDVRKALADAWQIATKGDDREPPDPQAAPGVSFAEQDDLFGDHDGWPSAEGMPSENERIDTDALQRGFDPP